ncbi:MAG: hypothetical protein ACTSO7_07580 [Candidatus Heimdallarchaeota archaeon]
MKINELKVYTAFSSFTDKGMSILYDPDVPKMNPTEQRKIANYYSIILNYGESTGALYGPLPVAYHTEYLLYVYTFQIKNAKVNDERVVKNKSIVPAFLLIYFPTAYETYTSKARDSITNEIKNWLVQFETAQDIKEKKILNLTSQIEAAIFKAQSQFALSEIEEANVVVSKSIQLLQNVVKYKEKPTKLLFSGTDDILISIAQSAIIGGNASLVTSYKAEKNKIDFKFINVEGTVLRTTAEDPNMHKYLSNDLDGVIHFANFSSEKSMEDHTNELAKIIKTTPQKCIISFVISQTDEPVKINETKLPEVLKEGIGRSISLIDLAQEKNNLSTSIIEFLDKIIEISGKN